MTDEERIELLETLHRKSGYTGRCVMRMSINGRGWRLHKTLDGGSGTVREAIDKFFVDEGE